MTMGRHILCRALTRLPCFELQPMIIALHCAGLLCPAPIKPENRCFLPQCDNPDLRSSPSDPEPTPVSAHAAAQARFHHDVVRTP
jgi:hypothetical protein